MACAFFRGGQKPLFRNARIEKVPLFDSKALEKHDSRRERALNVPVILLPPAPRRSVAQLPQKVRKGHANGTTKRTKVQSRVRFDGP
jgi:hypothetical protein